MRRPCLRLGRQPRLRFAHAAPATVSRAVLNPTADLPTSLHSLALPAAAETKERLQELQGGPEPVEATTLPSLAVRLGVCTYSTCGRVVSNLSPGL